MKKHFEVIKSMMALCLLLFLSGCSEKNMMPAEESVSEQKEQLSDVMLVEEPIKEQKTQAVGTLSTYGSEVEMYAAQTKRLAQKLVREGQIKDEYDLIFVDACQRDIPYNYAYFHDYAYKEESALDVHYPYELYYVSFSENGEITYYYTLLDYYVSTLDSGETVIFAGNEQDEVIREVTDLSTALKQESPFKYSSSQMFPWVKLFKSGIDLIRVLENQWSTDQLARLQDPVTAAETLLLLRGGKGEIVDRSRRENERIMLVSGAEGGVIGKVVYLNNEENFDNGMVKFKYQFANGEEITYDMTFDGKYWMPMTCVEKDDEIYPELKNITDDQKRYEMISSLAAKSITMDDIESAVYYKNSESSSGGMLQVEINDESLGIFRCGNAQFFTDWKECYLIEDVSVSTFACYDNYQTDCFDYDGDGQKEYAFAIQTLGGPGNWYEDLYIFDIENDHLSVRSFNYWDMSIESIKSILPEGWHSGPHVSYKLEKGQIIFTHGVTFPRRQYHGEMGYVHAKFVYHVDGSYELTEPQFEMLDEMDASIEKEKVLLQYSASELRKVKRYYKGESVQKTETPNYEVVIVAEDSKADTAVYGICDEYRDVTVLRVKDDIYRLQLNDWSFYEDRQKVLSGYDYDGDGEIEYLYYETEKYGSFYYNINMFDISDGKLKVVNCRDYFTTAELESLLAEKFNSGDYSRGDFDISLNEHSIKCEQTVFGEGNNGGYFEKALIRCDVKYEADGKFAFENPVITMLEEK